MSQFLSDSSQIWMLFVVDLSDLSNTYVAIKSHSAQHRYLQVSILSNIGDRKLLMYSILVQLSVIPQESVFVHVLFHCSLFYFFLYENVVRWRVVHDYLFLFWSVLFFSNEKSKCLRVSFSFPTLFFLALAGSLLLPANPTMPPFLNKMSTHSLLIGCLQSSPRLIASTFTLLSYKTSQHLHLFFPSPFPTTIFDSRAYVSQKIAVCINK